MAKIAESVEAIGRSCGGRWQIGAVPVKYCDSIKNENDRYDKQQSLKRRTAAQQQNHRATEAKQQSKEQNERPRHASAEDHIHEEANGGHAKKSRCQKILKTVDGQILEMAAEPVSPILRNSSHPSSITIARPKAILRSKGPMDISGSLRHFRLCSGPSRVPAENRVVREIFADHSKLL